MFTGRKHVRQRLFTIFGAVLLTASFCVTSLAVDFSSIEGTYVLQSRTLADGTVLTPPAAVGLYTMSDGYVNFNLAVKDKSGKVISRSFIAKYTISGPTFTEEVLYFAENDGPGIKYDMTANKRSTEMVEADGNIEVEYPHGDKIFGSYTPDSLTAMKSGEFIDKWVKVK